MHMMHCASYKHFAKEHILIDDAHSKFIAFFMQKKRADSSFRTRTHTRSLLRQIKEFGT